MVRKVISIRVYRQPNAKPNPEDMVLDSSLKAAKRYKTRIIQSPSIKQWLEDNVELGNYKRMKTDGSVSSGESIYEILFEKEEDVNLIRLMLGHQYIFVEIDNGKRKI